MGWLFARTLPNVGLLYGSDGAQQVKRVIKGEPSSCRHNLNVLFLTAEFRARLISHTLFPVARTSCGLAATPSETTSGSLLYSQLADSLLLNPRNM